MAVVDKVGRKLFFFFFLSRKKDEERNFLQWKVGEKEMKTPISLHRGSFLFSVGAFYSTFWAVGYWNRLVGKIFSPAVNCSVNSLKGFPA